MKLENKVSIVTGGGSGIGKTIAKGLAEEGSDVVIADIDYRSADRVASEISTMGRQGLPIEVDVSKEGEVKEMVEKAVDRFERIDVLVNNAGVMKVSSVVEMEEEEWDQIIDVNLKGTFLCSKAVAPFMMERKEGKIINISSTSGKAAFIGQAHYCASKFGIIGFTRVLAKELARYNVNVNAVCPGIVRTNMWDYLLDLNKKGELPEGLFPEGVEDFDDIVSDFIPLKRPQKSEDIANAVVFFASSDSVNITGQSLLVSGGLVMD